MSGKSNMGADPSSLPQDAAGGICALTLQRDRATLSTTMRHKSAAGPAYGGAAYGSLVIYALGPDGAPYLLLSDLADHTKNLADDPHASLLLDGTAGLSNPLTGSRATLMGVLERVPRTSMAFEQGMARFVRRHASAAFYAGFGDFNLYRMSVESGHIVAGFGKIDWVTDPLRPMADMFNAAADLWRAEADVVSHMNEDHLDAVHLYANRLLGLPGVGWYMTGVDALGCDIARDGVSARLWFPKPVSDAEGARVELVRLVKQSRGL